MSKAITKTLAAIYQNRRPDGHWFDKEALSFFKSSVVSIVSEDLSGAIYFVTKETNPSGKTLYTARIMDADGNVEDYGGFHQHTRGKALRLADRARRLNLGASEVGNGRHAANCILDAKSMWEDAGGTITDKVNTMRENAETWAGRAGWTVDWSTGILPTLSKGFELRFIEFYDRMIPEGA